MNALYLSCQKGSYMDKVVIFARVSTDRQEYLRQLIELREYCVKAGWQVVREFANKVSGVLNIISSYTIIWNPAINPAGQSRPVHTSPVTSKRKSGAERRIRSISDNGCCHLKSVPLYLKDLTTR